MGSVAYTHREVYKRQDRGSSFGGSYMGGGSTSPTPAAMPQMMQGGQMYQSGFGQGYQPQQPYGQVDYGMGQPGMQYQGGMQQPQQPGMPQMEYGQQYQGGMQQPCLLYTSRCV